MSYYAEIDDERKTGGDVATTKGWKDFADTIQAQEGLNELKNLVVDGWSDELDELASDLKESLALLSDSDESIAAGLLAILAKRDDESAVIVISDGVGGDNHDHSQEQEDQE